jgi:polyhydroxyalkanoate synthesis regulator phasin
MIELFEKTLMAGVGALSLTQQKTEELVGEMKSRLDLSEEKGRELLDRLQKTAQDNQKKLEKMAQDEVQKACARIGVVTDKDIKSLQSKIRKLEKELKELKKG